MQRKIKFEENINLIRKIAWSFHHTTNIELEELFAEASLAYCEALKNYNPKRGNITTYLWIRITDRLKNYLKEHKQYYNVFASFEDVTTDKPIYSEFIFESLSREAQQIADIILKYPNKYISMPSHLAKREVRKTMKNKGWPWKRIISGIQELQFAFSK